MTHGEIVFKIIHALADYLKRDPASITEAHHLRDDLGLDSMAVIELLFEIEDKFKIQIPDQDLPGLSTVASVALYVQKRLASPQLAAAPKPAPSRKPASSKTPKKQGAAGSTKRAAITKKKKKVASR
jgi:acyl carrier protein